MKKTTIRFDEDVAAMIDELKDRENSQTVNKIVNDAIRHFYKKNNFNEVFAKIKDEELEQIYKKWTKSSYATQIRLNAREAAVDSQIIMEMLNSIIFALEHTLYKITSNKQEFEFIPIRKKPHRISSNAKKAVIDKIAKAKQKKDFREK